MPRTVGKFKRFAFLDIWRLGKLFLIVQHIQQRLFGSNRIAQCPDSHGATGLFQLDLDIGSDGKAVRQAHSDAVAGLEGLGVDGVVNGCVYTGYTKLGQARCAKCVVGKTQQQVKRTGEPMISNCVKTVAISDSVGHAMTDIISRAFELAKSGNCRSVYQIEKRLSREGHAEASEHLSGTLIRRQLNALIRIAEAIRVSSDEIRATKVDGAPLAVPAPQNLAGTDGGIA